MKPNSLNGPKFGDIKPTDQMNKERPGMKNRPKSGMDISQQKKILNKESTSMMLPGFDSFSGEDVFDDIKDVQQSKNSEAFEKFSNLKQGNKIKIEKSPYVFRIFKSEDSYHKLAVIDGSKERKYWELVWDKDNDKINVFRGTMGADKTKISNKPRLAGKFKIVSEAWSDDGPGYVECKECGETFHTESEDAGRIMDGGWHCKHCARRLEKEYSLEEEIVIETNAMASGAVAGFSTPVGAKPEKLKESKMSKIKYNRYNDVMKNSKTGFKLSEKEKSRASEDGITFIVRPMKHSNHFGVFAVNVADGKGYGINWYSVETKSDIPEAIRELNRDMNKFLGRGGDMSDRGRSRPQEKFLKHKKDGENLGEAYPKGNETFRDNVKNVDSYNAIPKALQKLERLSIKLHRPGQRDSNAKKEIFNDLNDLEELLTFIQLNFDINLRQTTESKSNKINENNSSGDVYSIDQKILEAEPNKRVLFFEPDFKKTATVSIGDKLVKLNQLGLDFDNAMKDYVVRSSSALGDPKLTQARAFARKAQIMTKKSEKFVELINEVEKNKNILGHVFLNTQTNRKIWISHFDEEFLTKLTTT
jgi:hypothetical protein